MDPFIPSTNTFGLQQHYFQLGGTHVISRGTRVEPFAGGTIGAALFIPDQINKVSGGLVQANDTWAFAMTLGGGANIFLSPKVAIRLDARLMLPMFFSGGSFFVGSGGSGMAVNMGVPSVQGQFTAGITFAP